MIKINNLEDAEKFVAHQSKAGSQTYWDNYDIVVFRPNPRAEYSRFGAYRNGVWGYLNRSQVQPDGTWLVDRRNILFDD